jgi:hypothetical protein
VAGAEWLQFVGVHLHGDALPDEFNRKDDPKTALLAYHDTFQAGERPGRDAYFGPRLKIGMRLGLSSLKRAAKAFNFIVRKRGRRMSLAHERQNARHLDRGVTLMRSYVYK